MEVINFLADLFIDVATFYGSLVLVQIFIGDC